MVDVERGIERGALGVDAPFVSPAWPAETEAWTVEAEPASARGAFDPFAGVLEIVVDHGYARANMLPATASPRAGPPPLNGSAIAPGRSGEVAQPWRGDLSIPCRTAQAPTS